MGLNPFTPSAEDQEATLLYILDQAIQTTAKTKMDTATKQKINSYFIATKKLSRDIARLKIPKGEGTEGLVLMAPQFEQIITAFDAIPGRNELGELKTYIDNFLLSINALGKYGKDVPPSAVARVKETYVDFLEAVGVSVVGGQGVDMDAILPNIKPAERKALERALTELKKAVDDSVAAAKKMGMPTARAAHLMILTVVVLAPLIVLFWADLKVIGGEGTTMEKTIAGSILMLGFIASSVAAADTLWELQIQQNRRPYQK
ncbi:MAG: hypothetical protein HYS81_04660 [Candidatus Aenigmatarchaeota archaeon]|nr:MAG: hypothetical protein HYS81_04660 [Candidatus Aenigmarchaeota archaeon]